MSYFQTQCPTCGAVYMTGMVGSTFMGGHDCPVAIPEGCVVDGFQSCVCSRGTKSCVVQHEDGEK